MKYDIRLTDTSISSYWVWFEEIGFIVTSNFEMRGDADKVIIRRNIFASQIITQR